MSFIVKELNFSYQTSGPWKKRILENITFELMPGQILGITGPPGSGKSTLLKLMSGLLKAGTEQILLDGEDINDLTDKKNRVLREKVGFVFQFPEKQLFARTVFEDVAFGPTNWGIKPDELLSRVKEAMELVGLDFEKFKDRRPLGLSGGEKRKVAIAGILSIKPRYLLLDEPTAGMDNESRQKLLHTLVNLRQKNNIGMIIVSHRPQDLLQVADHIMLLRDGKAIYYGDTLEIIERIEAESGAVTQSRELLYRLREKGLTPDLKIRTPEEAARNITMVMGGKK